MFKELLGDAFPLIEKIAPTVATALGSPVAGIAASWVLSAIAKKFNVDPALIHNLAPAIMSDNEYSDKLTEVESTFGNWLQNQNMHITAPSKAEINIKLEWNNATSPN